jgi:hypothetical protein
MEVSLEKLFVSLDDVASALESTGTGQRVHMKLTNNQDADISICTQDNYPQKSCTLYLVSKSGQSIPVTVVMSSTGQNGESIITLKQSAGAGEDSNIYTAKPIALDIPIADFEIMMIDQPNADDSQIFSIFFVHEKPVMLNVHFAI